MAATGGGGVSRRGRYILDPLAAPGRALPGAAEKPGGVPLRRRIGAGTGGGTPREEDKGGGRGQRGGGGGGGGEEDRGRGEDGGGQDKGWEDRGAE